MVTETGLSNIFKLQNPSGNDFHKIEQLLLSMELEIGLLHKQVIEVGKFQEEVREFEAKKQQANAL